METELKLTLYKNTDIEFVDYSQFDDYALIRARERDAFINNEKYVPEYKYPRFDDLTHASHRKKKHKIYEAVMQLDALKTKPGVDIDEIELFARTIEVRLKRIMLIEAASKLGSSTISNSTTEVNCQSFNKLNEELYGKINLSYYLGIMATEKDRLDAFEPKSVVAADIKSDLELLLVGIDVGDNQEKILLNDIEVRKLHEYMTTRYANVLSVIPDTSDDIFYDSAQCTQIINNALEVGGLAGDGWKAIEQPRKTIASTRGDKSTINIPGNSRRNAAELRYLMIHEQEVHARRAQNGKNTGIKPLERGTADYTDVEEGLGVMFGIATTGMIDSPSVRRVKNGYVTVGLALGIDGKPRDARETYEILWRIVTLQETGSDGDISDDIINRAKYAAYSNIENVYRGTEFWMKGVAYIKAKIYYEGLIKNAEYFKRNIDTLDVAFDDAFMGKYDHTNPTERELVKRLIARGQTIDQNVKK